LGPVKSSQEKNEKLTAKNAKKAKSNERCFLYEMLPNKWGGGGIRLIIAHFYYSFLFKKYITRFCNSLPYFLKFFQKKRKKPQIYYPAMLQVLKQWGDLTYYCIKSTISQVCQ
jgi:hypothetical protein